MTTGTRIDPGDREFRHWAADQLGTSPDASATAARTAFCSLLRDADFVPPIEWHSAYKVLAVDPNVATASVFNDPNILRDLQGRLRTEIDELASEFFDLEPEERRNRWGDLKVRAASFKSLSNWLDALAPGLDIRKDMTIQGPPQMFGLFLAVLRNFVLRPTEAAWHRQRFIEECLPEIGAYEVAARQLQKRFPSLAALAPDLVTQLATWSEARRQHENKRQKVRAALRQAASVLFWLSIPVIMGIGIPFIVGIFTNDDKKSSRPAVESPRYQAPQIQFKPWNEMSEQEKRGTGRAIRRLLGAPVDWEPKDEPLPDHSRSNDNEADERDSNLRAGAEVMRLLREAKEKEEREGGAKKLKQPFDPENPFGPPPDDPPKAPARRPPS